jgi:hypothetical protein
VTECAGAVQEEGSIRQCALDRSRDCARDCAAEVSVGRQRPVAGVHRWQGPRVGAQAGGPLCVIGALEGTVTSYDTQ